MLGRPMLRVLGGGMLLVGVMAGPASAESQDGRGRCIAELAQAGAFGPGVNPRSANILVGTEGDDTFELTSGVDLVCGFGGNDAVDPGSGEGTFHPLSPGEVFLGGAGRDIAAELSGGTFNGGDDADAVVQLFSGTFNGGAGDDRVDSLYGGTFNGGPGNDRVNLAFGGTFNQ